MQARLPLRRAPEVALVRRAPRGAVAVVGLGEGESSADRHAGRPPEHPDRPARTPVVACRGWGGHARRRARPSISAGSATPEFGAPRYHGRGSGGSIAYVTDSTRGDRGSRSRSRRVVHAERTWAGRPGTLTAFGRTLWTALRTKAGQDRRARPLRPDAAATRRHDRTIPRATSASPRAVRASGYLLHSRPGRGLRGRHAPAALRFAADSPPQRVTFLAGRAYVTTGTTRRLRFHALDGRLLRTRAIPLGSYNVQEGWGVVLTPSLSQGTLCVVDRRGAMRNRLRVASSSHDICFSMAR